MRQLCTFTVDDILLGVDVLSVQEVLRHQEMTTVPLAPAVVRGLINLRGQIVTAIDLRQRFGQPPAPPGALPINVVVRTDDGPVSLLVDQIGDVVDADDASFEPPPETLAGEARELIDSICKLNGRLLLALSVKRAVDLSHVTADSERKER
jgi:purine-binding chemotaxis protein CheW